VRKNLISNIKVQINIKHPVVQEVVDPPIKWLETFLKSNKEAIPRFRVEYLAISQNPVIPISPVDTNISQNYVKHLRVCGFVGQKIQTML